MKDTIKEQKDILEAKLHLLNQQIKSLSHHIQPVENVLNKLLEAYGQHERAARANKIPVQSAGRKGFAGITLGDAHYENEQIRKENEWKWAHYYVNQYNEYVKNTGIDDLKRQLEQLILAHNQIQPILQVLSAWLNNRVLITDHEMEIGVIEYCVEDTIIRIRFTHEPLDIDNPHVFTLSWQNDATYQFRSGDGEYSIVLKRTADKLTIESCRSEPLTQQSNTTNSSFSTPVFRK